MRVKMKHPVSPLDRECMCVTVCVVKGNMSSDNTDKRKQKRVIVMNKAVTVDKQWLNLKQV